MYRWSTPIPAALELRIIARPNGRKWAHVVEALGSARLPLPALASDSFYLVDTDAGSTHLLASGAMHIVLGVQAEHLPDWLEALLAELEKHVDLADEPMLNPIRIDARETPLDGTDGLAVRVIKRLRETRILGDT